MSRTLDNIEIRMRKAIKASFNNWDRGRLSDLEQECLNMAHYYNVSPEFIFQRVLARYFRFVPTSIKNIKITQSK